MKYLLLFVIIIVQSCSSKPVSVILEKTSQIEIKIDGNTSYNINSLNYRIDEKEGTENLYFNPRNSGVILCYSLIKNSICDTIQLPIEIKSFSVINKDSFVLVKMRGNENIYLGSKQYGFKELSSYEFPLRSSNFEYGIHCSMQGPIYSDQSLYVTLYERNLNAGAKEYYQSNVLCYLKLDDMKPVIFGNWPDLYKNNYDYYYIEPFFCVNNKNEIIVSFAKDHKIYVYKNGNLKSTEEIKSRYISEFQPLTQRNSTSNITFDSINRYLVSQPEYANILYDPYRDLYYRIVGHKSDALNSNGFINNTYDRAFSVIAFDSDFRIISEIDFPAGEYYYMNIFVSKAGLMIQKREEHKPNFKDDRILFDVFGVTKK